MRALELAQILGQPCGFPVEGALGRQCGAAHGCAASRTTAASATLATPASAMGTVTLRAGWYEAGRLHLAPPRVLHGVCPAAARGAASACSARGLTVTSGDGYRLLCDDSAGALSVRRRPDPPLLVTIRIHQICCDLHPIHGGARRSPWRARPRA